MMPEGRGEVKKAKKERDWTCARIKRLDSPSSPFLISVSVISSDVASVRIVDAEPLDQV